jgi:dCMP deaminase
VERPSWDEYFMTIAEQVATRSTCMRRQIGAVIVKDKRILSTGYNGAPSGLSHCDVVGCLREQLHIPSGEKTELCRAIHAEQNAVVQAARYGIPIEGATIYTTTQPCVQCAKILMNAGIVEIVYQGTYPDQLACDMLAESGIEVRRMER